MTYRAIPKGLPAYSLTPLAVSIEHAAQMVAVSRTRFCKVYIQTGRVRPLKLRNGPQVIDVDELRKAYAQLRNELRQAPEG